MLLPFPAITTLVAFMDVEYNCLNEMHNKLKKIILTLLIISGLNSCQKEDISLTQTITHADLVEIQHQVNESILTLSLSGITEGYENYDVFINSASKLEIDRYQHLATQLKIDEGLLRKMVVNDLEVKKVLKNEYFLILNSNLNNDSRFRTNGCPSDCLFAAHEMWFDLFYTFQSDVTCDLVCADYHASLFSGAFHAGCESGCS